MSKSTSLRLSMIAFDPKWTDWIYDSYTGITMYLIEKRRFSTMLPFISYNFELDTSGY